MSDNINGITPEKHDNLSREDKIKAIKKSVKKSANDWDGERSAMFSEKVLKVMDNRPEWPEEYSGVLDDMPEDAVPSEEIYAGIGLGDFHEIIPDSDIPLFDADGMPVNGIQPDIPKQPEQPEMTAESIIKAVDEKPVLPTQEAVAEEPVKNFEHVSESTAPVSGQAETPVLAALRNNDEIADENTHIYANDAVRNVNGNYSEKAVNLEKESSQHYGFDDDLSEPAPIPSAPARRKVHRRKKTLGEKFRDLFPRSGDSGLECARKIIFLVSVVAIVVCGYLVADYYIDLWHSKSVNKDMMNLYWTYPDKHEEEEEQTEKYYDLLDGAKKLLDINPDVIGVISIPETPINNPVMKAEDNSKYLNMKINGDESRAGELFMDYRNKFDHVEDHRLAEPNSDNLVIYGHNMGDLTMFGCLQHYRTDEDYYSEHPLIYLNSNYESYIYKIFSVFILDAEDKSYDCWNTLNFDSEEEFYDFVNEAKRRTFRLNDVDVKYGDPLITLSTCNDILGDRGRFIVMARRVRDGEDPLEGTKNNSANPNVKWPDFYYSIRTNEKYDPDAEFIPYGPDKTEE